MRAVDNPQGGVATQRDQYGRLRAPVFINGKGPFSLIVDTGANGSAVTVEVVHALGLSLESSPEVILRAVTGASRVGSITVDSLSLGDLVTPPATLPVVCGALDGCDGFLGTGAFADKRLLIDFRRGRIVVSASKTTIGGRGFIKVPADLSRSRLAIADTHVNGRKVKAIIDTGAAGTIGNSAMRNLLVGVRVNPHRDQIIGANAEVDYGQTLPMPLITLGALRIIGARVSVADISIFDHFELSQKPALLIGMDVLGQLDSMTIDYRMRELQMRVSAPPVS